MSQRILARARRICLGLPEATEKEAWSRPTFRVKKKMFAMFMDDHHGDGRTAFWLKADAGVQEMLVETDPERFFVPPYMGPSGWIGVNLRGGVDWAEVENLVEDAYRAAAPSRLVGVLDERSKEEG